MGAKIDFTHRTAEEQKLAVFVTAIEFRDQYAPAREAVARTSRLRQGLRKYVPAHGVYTKVALRRQGWSKGFLPIRAREGFREQYRTMGFGDGYFVK